MPQRGAEDDTWLSGDFAGFLNEFDAESDRAAAVLAAAFLDEQIKSLIEDFFVDDSKEVDRLLGINRPLGGFSSRIHVAFCMGLLSRDELHDLRIIRDIRNKFAHRLHGLTFEDEWVRQKCDALKLPGTAPEWPIHKGARNPFTVASALLTVNLVRRGAQFQHERRVVPRSFEIDEKMH